MKQNKPFSLRARAKSFRYALDGIISFFKAEHNSRLHLLATVAVFVAAIVLHVSASEMIALILAIGFVWVAELFNTAVEKIMDFISTEQDEKIKFIKDVSAAAVLVAAGTAIAVGCFVFIPKL